MVFFISISQYVAQDHGVQPWKVKFDFMKFFLIYFIACLRKAIYLGVNRACRPSTHRRPSVARSDSHEAGNPLIPGLCSNVLLAQAEADTFVRFARLFKNKGYS
jgi:hypothetical protein